MFEILYVIPCTSHEKLICNNCAKHSEMSQPSYCLLISSRGGFTISNSISVDIVYKREPVFVVVLSVNGKIKSSLLFNFSYNHQSFLVTFRAVLT